MLRRCSKESDLRLSSESCSESLLHQQPAPRSLVETQPHSNISASTASVGRATAVSVIVLGVLLVLLLLFLSWKMRHHLLCPCCQPAEDDLGATEADNLLRVAQAMHSAPNAGLQGSRQMPEHAVKKGFDHLPSYIAAKLAGYRQAKQHKRRREGSRSASPSRGSNSRRGIQMMSRTGKSHLGRQHRSGRKEEQLDDAALDETVNRSDDSMEALIGVGSEHLDPELMQSGPSNSDEDGRHSRASSVSLSLTEQYSIASCSYPPLPAPDLQQLASGIPLSAAASAELEQECNLNEHIV